MEHIVCARCYAWLPLDLEECPSCHSFLALSGQHKNVIDRLQPNCLITRLPRSDILEPAVMLRQEPSAWMVATRLQEYPAPLAVSKDQVYHFNPSLLSAIQALRNQRTAALTRYDRQIRVHWKNLKPYQ